MPKHFKTPAEKWAFFLNTVLGDASNPITVTKVTKEKLYFKSPSHDTKVRLEQLLKNPHELRTHIIHAIPRHVTEDASDPTQNPSLLKSTDEIKAVLDKSAIDVINRLFDESVVQVLRQELTTTGDESPSLTMVENTRDHTGTIRIDQTQPPAVIRFHMARLELIQVSYPILQGYMKF